MAVERNALPSPPRRPENQASSTACAGRYRTKPSTGHLLRSGVSSIIQDRTHCVCGACNCFPPPLAALISPLIPLPSGQNTHSSQLSKWHCGCVTYSCLCCLSYYLSVVHNCLTCNSATDTASSQLHLASLPLNRASLHQQSVHCSAVHMQRLRRQQLRRQQVKSAMTHDC